MIACFGQTSKGRFGQPYYLKNAKSILSILGKVPEDTLGMPFALEMLKAHKDILFFRVAEEGLSLDDYLRGLQFLKKNCIQKRLLGIYLSGCFDKEVVSLAVRICNWHKSILLATQKEMIDYLAM